MTLATRLPDPREPAQRAGHDAGWTADDWTWLHDHDGEAHHQRGYPDPTGDAAVARADRQRNQGGGRTTPHPLVEQGAIHAWAHSR